MTAFIPRATFTLPSSLPKTYFLGHHKAGLDRMKHLLSTIDLIIECRDYRIPLTSRNPVLERELGLSQTPANGGKHRIIVYTKCDLGFDSSIPSQRAEARAHNEALRALHPTDMAVHFSAAPALRTAFGGRVKPRPQGALNNKHHDTVKSLLSHLRTFARENFSLTGHRVLVAGMPNVGKSSLLNSLRKAGISADHRSKKKVAQTGANPGVTRSVSGAIKILEAKDVASPSPKHSLILNSNGKIEEGDARVQRKSKVQEATTEPVYLMDTPGIFPPYIHSPASMLKLILCGCAKDTLVPPITLVDYLLFNLNLRGLEANYAQWSEPTNDVSIFLEGVGRKTGKFSGTGKGAVDMEAAALWIVQRWRQGGLGRFVFDDLGEEALRTERGRVDEGTGDFVSWSQALKREKERRRERGRERRSA